MSELLTMGFFIIDPCSLLVVGGGAIGFDCGSGPTRGSYSAAKLQNELHHQYFCTNGVYPFDVSIFSV